MTRECRRAIRGIEILARPGGFEPPTPRFVVWCSDPAELRAQSHSMVRPHAREAGTVMNNPGVGKALFSL